ncbi:DnaA/Hda family protein [Geotalea toluenoxydans]
MQLIFDFPVNSKYGFDNFVVCAGNKTAYHFARQLAEGDGTENLLYLYGAKGSGKTHLLTAIANSIGIQSGLAALPSISFKDIDKIYDGHYPAEELSKLAEQFKNSPALLIDDIHLIPDNNSIRVELWQLFNDFYTAGKKIAISGLYPPKELPNLDGHLTSRLLWGLVSKLDISGDDSLRMILQKLAEDRQIVVPEEVTAYLLVHLHRDIPTLLNALQQIHRHALMTKKKISLRQAKEALSR